MSFMDTVKNILNIEPPSPTLQLVVINSADNLAELPRGFFNVIAKSGRKSLGYNGSWWSFDVGETVVDGMRITLDKPRLELPTVKLDFRSQNAQTVMGHAVIEVDAGDCDVEWDGKKPLGSDGGWI